MQTIKCVVVGDGAVGKVMFIADVVIFLLLGPNCLYLDLSFDFLYYKQISF